MKDILGDLGGHDVDVVHLGDTTDDVGCFNTGLAQDVAVDRNACDLDAVDVVCLKHQLAVAFDNDDVMFQSYKLAGQGRTHFATADDDDLHGFPPFQLIRSAARGQSS